MESSTRHSRRTFQSLSKCPYILISLIFVDVNKHSGAKYATHTAQLSLKRYKYKGRNKLLNYSCKIESKTTPVNTALPNSSSAHLRHIAVSYSRVLPHNNSWFQSAICLRTSSHDNSSAVTHFILHLYFKQSLVSLKNLWNEVWDSQWGPSNGSLLTVANVLCSKNLPAPAHLV